MNIPRAPLPAGLGLDTLAVREGLPASAWGENSEALFLTSCFVHPDAASAARRFANEEDAFVYSRFSNPNVTIMERRLAALEGTTGCIGTASGMGAILLMFMGLLKAGDHVVCSQSVFGATIKLLQTDLGKFGVESTFVSQTDLAQWRSALRPQTPAVVRRDAYQPDHRGLRHPGPGRPGP
jgi:O-succinylhomoserine sulfhydrylase